MRLDQEKKYQGSIDDYLQIIEHSLIDNDLGTDSLDLYDFRAFAKFCPIDQSKLIGKAPHDVLVLCNENQGRSQIASFVMQEIANTMGLAANFRSAGKRASPWKYGGKLGPEVIDFMQKLGLEAQNATVNQLKNNDVAWLTLLIDLSGDPDLLEYADLAALRLSHAVDDIMDTDPEKIRVKIPEMYKSLFLFCLRFTFKLAEATEKSDYQVLTQYFMNKDNRSTLQFSPERLSVLSQFR